MPALSGHPGVAGAFPTGGGDPPEVPESAGPGTAAALWRTRLRTEAPLYLAAGGVLAVLAGIALRSGGLGGGAALPQGTNALSTWLVFGYLHQHPDSVWLFPFTDWGQPYPGFTGPTLWTLLGEVAGPTTAVRLVEGASFVAAGLATLGAIRTIGGGPVAAGAAGIYYSLTAETSQYFEGHVPAMVSVALGPLFLVLLWRFLRRPAFGSGLSVVLVLYVLASVGDIGLLYFYAFFAVPLAVYVALRRNDRVRYRLREFGVVALGLLLLAALSISAWLPVVFGVRPQYTTSITTNIVPFSQVSGENLGYAFAGYVQDNSFVHYTYHQFAFGPGGGYFLPFAWLIPVAIAAYVLVTRRTDRLVAFGSAVLAIVFSTGHLYPGLSAFNGAVYDHVPFFDSIPEVYRWTEYAILVYALLLGSLLTSLERELAAGLPTVRRRLSALRPLLSPDGVRRAEGWLSAGHRRARTFRWALVPTIGLVVVLLAVAQDVSVLTEPPGTYELPPAYSASFTYLSDRPLSGEVLSIPFGAIYDRTPWGGVGASAALLTPSYTGADTDIFEAGTVPSLALDNFLSNGLTFGGSRNMTKFLGSVNVQYVVTNDYSNWSYSSSSISSPRLSYSALANQSGLGPGTAISSVQTVYAPGNWAGNLSFHPSYLLYFGADSILYSILDSTWYPGPSMALVDGDSVGAALPEFEAHAAGIVVDPAGLATLGNATIATAARDRIPVIEVVPPSEFAGRGTEVRGDAWNVTGGVDLQFDQLDRNASINLSAQLLFAAGFRNLTLSGQLAGPPGAVVSVALGSRTVQQSLLSGSVAASVVVNSSAPGFFSAGVENSTFRGNLSAVGNGSAVWTPDSAVDAFQYVRLNVSDLQGWNGLQVTVAGAAPVPLVERLWSGSTFFDVSGYPTVVPTAKNLWRYWFVYPAGDEGMPSTLLQHLGNVTSVEVGLRPPAPAPALTLSNVTLLAATAPRLTSVDLGPVAADGATLNVSLPPSGRLGVLEVSTGSFPTPTPYLRDVSPQGSPTHLRFGGGASGWGVLTLAQTYSSEWQLSGASGALAQVDVGLTGWLVNATPSAVFSVQYGGDQLEQQALILESVAVPLALIPWGVVGYRAARRGRFGGAPPS